MGLMEMALFTTIKSELKPIGVRTVVAMATPAGR